MNLVARIAPLLRHDLTAWTGLPDAGSDDFDAAFGAPVGCEAVTLGELPAERRHYEADGPGGGFFVYARDGDAVMIETQTPPPVGALAALGEPDATLPRELRLEDAYAHEYLWCARGLVLTVAVPLGGLDDEDDGVPERIVRCRGLRPLDRVGDFGPAYYRPLDSRVRWVAAGGR